MVIFIKICICYYISSSGKMAIKKKEMPKKNRREVINEFL
jgi:hypothetical protein